MHDTPDAPLSHTRGPWPGVRMPKARISPRQMARRITGLRAQLVGLGLPRGARVAVRLDDPVTALAAFYGGLGSGLVLVPVHSATPPPEMRHILADSGAAALLCDSDPPPDALPDTRPDAEIALIRPAGTASDPDFDPDSDPDFDPGPDPEAPAVILYTSGTTGAPKGVVFTHANLDQIGHSFPSQVLDLSEQDVLLLPLELNSPIGVVLAVCAHASRAELALTGRIDPARLTRTLRDTGVSVMLGVPTLAALMLAASRTLDDPLPALRHVVLGGNPVTDDLAARIRQRFGCALSVVFAMTELIPGLILRDRVRAPDGAIGWPAPGLTAAILGADGQALPDDAVGELAVRGPQLQAGYWRAGRIAPLTGADGWYRTGDLGYRGADGGVVLVGRAKDVILTGGYTVYPLEVEQVLETHPGIDKAALVGKPHRDFGEIPVAFVVPVDAANAPNEAALIRWAKDRLLAAKCPRAVHVIDSMPMTGSGKIRKTALKTRFGHDPA